MGKPNHKSAKKEVKSAKPFAKHSAPKKDVKSSSGGKSVAKVSHDKSNFSKSHTKKPTAKPTHKEGTASASKHSYKSNDHKNRSADHNDHKKGANTSKVTSSAFNKPPIKKNDAKGASSLVGAQKGSVLKHNLNKAGAKSVDSVKASSLQKNEIKKGDLKSDHKKVEIKENKKDLVKTPQKNQTTVAKSTSPSSVETGAPTTAQIKNNKAPGIKKKGTNNKEEFELGDDLVGEGDDFSSDELSEYQAELESAEEITEEKETVTIEEVVVSTVSISVKDKNDDIVLTDAEGRRYCRVKDCDQVSTVDGYCRFHYLLLWKKIQVRKKILTDGKLERYIEELTSRYPDKFLEVIRRDLRTEKDFVSAIQEMEIDESGVDNDFEDESSNFIDEVRGATTEGSIAEDDEY